MYVLFGKTNWIFEQKGTPLQEIHSVHNTYIQAYKSTHHTPTNKLIQFDQTSA